MVWLLARLPFLFIFVPFKHKFSRKTLGFSGIRTRIVGIEGKHADHLTTTTTQIVSKQFLCSYIEQPSLLKLALVWCCLK